MDDLKVARKIAEFALRAQSKRMRIISENLANADSVAETPGGIPYQRKLVVFKKMMDKHSGVQLINSEEITLDQSDFRRKYDPTHPMADKKGYILMPNVDPLIELADMREANKSYEASLQIIRNARSLMTKTIDLLN